MFHAEDSNTDNNSGNNGFVWSARLPVLAGLVLAAIVAAARFAPVLAGPLEWLPR